MHVFPNQGIVLTIRTKIRVPQLTDKACVDETTARLTVGPEEGWREEALIHHTRKGNNANHVVGVKAQTAERLTAQLLWDKNDSKSTEDQVW